MSSGLFAQTLYSLDEVERFLSRVTSRPVARRDQLQKGVRYDAALRLRLDVNQLPKPFQVECARLARMVAAVGLVSLELHRMSTRCASAARATARGCAGCC